MKRVTYELTFEGSHIYLLLPALFVQDRRQELSDCVESHGGKSENKYKRKKVNIKLFSQRYTVTIVIESGEITGRGTRERYVILSEA